MFAQRHWKQTLIVLATAGAVGLGWGVIGLSARPVPVPPPGTVMHVQAVLVNFANVGGPNRQPHAYVYIRDEFGAPVNGATVTGNWTGCTVQNGVTAVTQTLYNSSGQITADGVAHFVGKKRSCWGNNSCDFIFTVTNVAMTGLVYDPSSNVTNFGYSPCF